MWTDGSLVITSQNSGGQIWRTMREEREIEMREDAAAEIRNKASDKITLKYRHYRVSQPKEAKMRCSVVVV